MDSTLSSYVNTSTNSGVREALGAYRSAGLSSLSENSDAGLGNGRSPTSSDGSSEFLALVKESIQQARNANQVSETKAAEGLTGEADLIDVVTAVSNAEITLQTVVTVRDRVLESYQEILRMPI